ncbi:MAG: glycoside hydrolase family 3 protein, partial [Clostridiales bacterium]|nr:glycoside hydrolase family 3 protein [Clostridiales bacterium]
RLPPEFIKSESNRVIGENNDPLLSFEIGGIIAKQIKSLGFNINFAPVLDIDSNPNNPVIGDRSFGPDPNLVSELGIATMKGIQSQNIVPVIKHFPGHGDTDTDSHLGLPSVDKSFNDLMQFELIPFKNAIEDGADAVMVAHILYEMIDPLYPSTLSETIIQDLLRDQLGFNGIVITDDMTMGAIMDNYDVTEASIQSIKAGCDIVLVCHGYENIINVLEALKRAVENNEITEDRINQSVYRILTIKHKYGIENNRIEDIDIEQLNSEMESLLNNLTR